MKHEVPIMADLAIGKVWAKDENDKEYLLLVGDVELCRSLARQLDNLEDYPWEDHWVQIM